MKSDNYETNPQVTQWMNEAQKYFNAIQSPHYKDDRTREIACVLTYNGQVGKALSEFNDDYKLPRFVARVLPRIGDIKRASEIKFRKGIGRDPYNSESIDAEIGFHHVKNNNLERALGVADTMHTFHKDYILREVAGVLAKQGYLEYARQQIKDMFWAEGKALGCAAIAANLDQVGNNEEAQKYWNLARRALYSHSGMYKGAKKGSDEDIIRIPGLVLGDGPNPKNLIMARAKAGYMDDVLSDMEHQKRHQRNEIWAELIPILLDQDKFDTVKEIITRDECVSRIDGKIHIDYTPHEDIVRFLAKRDIDRAMDYIERIEYRDMEHRKNSFQLYYSEIPAVLDSNGNSKRADEFITYKLEDWVKPRALINRGIMKLGADRDFLKWL